MVKCVLWATTELAKHIKQVISMYQQILQSLNSLTLQLNLEGRLAEVRVIFILRSEEESLHNMAKFIDIAKYSVPLLREGKIPHLIQ
ncbi:F16G16.3 protein [Fagus crenata]|jgi:hypothetical protein